MSELEITVDHWPFSEQFSPFGRAYPILLGHIYYRFPMGKLLIVYCNVPALRNGRPISNCYFKLCMHTYTNRKCFINTCIEVKHMIRIRELGEQHWKSKLLVKLSKGEIYYLFC